MKITELYVYPIKGLRPIALESAELTRQGIRHDRRFMLWKVEDAATGALKKVQVYNVPAIALFSQRLVTRQRGKPEVGGDGDGWIEVRYHPPPTRSRTPGSPADDWAVDSSADDGSVLVVPLRPSTADLEPVEVSLLSSTATAAYRMPEAYGAWFAARLGFDVVLTYIGDGRRPVLGPSFLPLRAERKGAGAGAGAGSGSHIAFSDVAPYLITSRASLDDVSARLLTAAAAKEADGTGADGAERMDMRKFRPSVVVDGAGEAAWAEDFWGELTVYDGTRRARQGGGEHEPGRDEAAAAATAVRIALTANCGRCRSIDVDYATGATAEGVAGTVLKRLMRDRRVDRGNRWDPVFGRYGFLVPGVGEEGDGDDDDDDRVVAVVSVGDEVRVSRRNESRDVWDWPHKSAAAGGAAAVGRSAVDETKVAAARPRGVLMWLVSRVEQQTLTTLLGGALGCFVVLMLAVYLGEVNGGRRW